MILIDSDRDILWLFSYLCSITLCFPTRQKSRCLIYLEWLTLAIAEWMRDGVENIINSASFLHLRISTAQRVHEVLSIQDWRSWQIRVMVGPSPFSLTLSFPVADMFHLSAEFQSFQCNIANVTTTTIEPRSFELLHPTAEKANLQRLTVRRSSYHTKQLRDLERSIHCQQHLIEAFSFSVFQVQLHFLQY